MMSVEDTAYKPTSGAEVESVPSKPPISDEAAFALLNLAVDLFANEALTYSLADQVYSHILRGVEDHYGSASRKKVEELFVRQAACALAALKNETDLLLSCPACSSDFKNFRGV